MKGPKFLSKGQTFRVVAGDSLLLPCVLENLGELQIFYCFCIKSNIIITEKKVKYNFIRLTNMR